MDDSSSIWPDYYRATQDSPPRETLTRAITLFESEGARQRLAVDLGCGAGNDTLELLRRGWSVLAIDNEPEAIERVWARIADVPHGRLHTNNASFADAELPPCDLVNASFSLPFCPPEQFPVVWDKIDTALRPGGRFAGQLFGVRDTWAENSNMVFHTEGDARSLLSRFNVEFWNEREYDGTTALGGDKHWHVFSLVARKRSE